MAVTSIVSLLAGSGLALVTGPWMFLAFASTSAVTALLPLLGGMKRSRAFKAGVVAAVSQDRGRRTAAAPSLADFALTRPSHLPWPPVLKDNDDLPLRVGTGDQRANVVVDPPDPGFEAPVSLGLPLVVPLKVGEELAVVGPSASVESLVRGLLMQITVRGVRTVITGTSALLPLPARFLPRVSVTANVAALRGYLQGRSPILVIDMGGDTAIVRLLDDAFTEGKHRLIRCHLGSGSRAPSTAQGRVHLLRLGGDEAVVSSLFREQTFVPDLVSPQTFDRFAGGGLHWDCEPRKAPPAFRLNVCSPTWPD